MIGETLSAPQPVVLVTGASKGIGAYTCLWLAQAGADLAVVARDGAALSKVAQGAARRGAEVLELPGDVGAPGQPEQAVAAVLERFGRLDALVNNAGMVGPISHLTEVDLDAWRATIETNLIAPIAWAQAGAGALRQSAGRLVNVTSEVADMAAESLGAYGGTKAGLRHATKTLAREEDRITVIAYDPGPTDTALMDQIRQEAATAMSPAVAKAYRDLPASGRLVQPQDTARVLAWLALMAPPEWSGRVVDHADPDAVGPAQKAIPGPSPSPSDSW